MSRAKRYNKDKVDTMFDDLKKIMIWLQTQVDFSIGYLFRKPIVQMKTENITEILGLLKGKKFNIPLFESILINLSGKDLSKIKFNSEKYFSLFKDEFFIESISSQTNKRDKIEYRLKKVNEVFDYE